MNWKRYVTAAVLAVIASSVAVYAGGIYQTWVGIGWPSYCGSTVTGTGGLGGITGQGQGSTGSICGQTVPAGPAVFGGTEVAPFDLYQPGTVVTSGGAQSAFVGITQLGQGAVQILGNWTSGATVSMANNSEFLFVQPNLNGGLAASSALTVALPTTPVEGQMAQIACVTSSYAGSVTVIAAAGQALLPNPGFGYSCGSVVSSLAGSQPSSAPAYVSFEYRFVAITTPTTSTVNVSPTWYRVR